MDGQKLRNIQEAYSQVYEAAYTGGPVGRDEMIAANNARAKSSNTSTSSTPTSSTPVKSPNVGGSKPTSSGGSNSGGILGSLDKTARDIAGKIGGEIGASQGRSRTGNLPIISDIGATIGRNQGTQQGQQMYDKAKQVVGGFLKQDYEYDTFDIILEYLVAEGFADTNQAAIAIMANMSEEWRQSIIEAEVLAQKGGVPGTVQVKPQTTGGFLGIGAKTTNVPVSGTFKQKDVSSTDAARYNNEVDKSFSGTGSTDSAPASAVQRAAERSGHSGYMKVNDPDSIPNTGLPNRPTPQRAGDQNRAIGR